MNFKIGDYVSYEYINGVFLPGRILSIDGKSNKLKLEICIIDKEADSSEKEVVECSFRKVSKLKR